MGWMKKSFSVMVLVNLTLFVNCQDKYSRRQYVESSDVIAFPEEVPTNVKKHANYESENAFEVSQFKLLNISFLLKIDLSLDLHAILSKML